MGIHRVQINDADCSYYTISLNPKTKQSSICYDFYITMVVDTQIHNTAVENTYHMSTQYCNLKCRSTRLDILCTFIVRVLALLWNGDHLCTYWLVSFVPLFNGWIVVVPNSEIGIKKHKKYIGWIIDYMGTRKRMLVGRWYPGSGGWLHLWK